MRAAYLAGMTLLAAACHRQPPVPLPDTAEPLALLARETLAGPAFDPASVKGRPVVINVWSPGCVPCLHEAPGLQKAADELGVALVTIALEGTREAANAFVAKTGLRAPVILGDDALAAHFHVVAYPWTVLLDRSGKAVEAIRGGRSEDQFRSLLREVL